MDDKFAKFHLSISNMRKKVIEAKGGQQVQGLSTPNNTISEYSKKKQSKTQEKD